MDADDSVKGHDWVGPQHEALAVAFLRLVRIVHHVFLMKQHLCVLGNVLGFQSRTIVLFQEVDVVHADLDTLPLLC